MARMARMTRKRLGEILLEEGVLNDEQLGVALGEQRKSGQLLGHVLVDLGYATEYDIAKAIVAQFAWPYIPVNSYHIKDEVVELVPEDVCRQYHIVPLEKMENVLAIVAGGTLNSDILREVERLSGCHVRVYVGTYSEVADTINKHYGEKEYVPAASPLEGATVAPMAPAAAPAPTAVAQPQAAQDPAAAAVALAASVLEAGDAEVKKDADPAAAPEAAPAADAEEEPENIELSSLGSMLLGEEE